MTLVPLILQQHIEDTALHWLRRDTAVDQPHYDLADLAHLDNQLEAHADGLRVAGDDGWELCQQELQKWEEPGEVFAAAVMALESSDAQRIDRVLEIACSTPELQRGFISALGWTASENVEPLLAGWIVSDNPDRRRIGMGGYGIRRSNPGPALAKLLTDVDPRVCARACKAAGELGCVDLLRQVRQATSHKDDACRFWAAWAAVRLRERSPSVLQALRVFVEQPGPFQQRAAALAARVQPPNDVKQWLAPFWQVAETQRMAAIAIGALGDPDLIGVLLQLMQVNEVARVAGEAFSIITGVDLAYDDLDRDQPEGFQAGPTEDPADENVAMDADENLPWPHPQRVAGRWQAIESEFSAGHRYLCGREISPSSLPQTLYQGFQRQRSAAALELGLLDPQQPLFEVRARGDWQQQLLPRWFPAT